MFFLVLLKILTRSKIVLPTNQHQSHSNRVRAYFQPVGPMDLQELTAFLIKTVVRVSILKFTIPINIFAFFDVMKCYLSSTHTKLYKIRILYPYCIMHIYYVCCIFCI